MAGLSLDRPPDAELIVFGPLWRWHCDDARTVGRYAVACLSLLVKFGPATRPAVALASHSTPEES